MNCFGVTMAVIPKALGKCLVLPVTKRAGAGCMSALQKAVIGVVVLDDGDRPRRSDEQARPGS
jgi:hypothetical protein